MQANHTWVNEDQPKPTRVRASGREYVIPSAQRGKPWTKNVLHSTCRLHHNVQYLVKSLPVTPGIDSRSANLSSGYGRQRGCIARSRFGKVCEAVAFSSAGSYAHRPNKHLARRLSE